MSDTCIIPEFSNLKQLDPYLADYQYDFEYRYKQFLDALDEIEKNEEGGLEKFSQSFRRFGLNIDHDGVIRCLEWIPGAKAVSLVGDFNNWNPEQYKFEKLDFGKWKLEILPNEDHTPKIEHMSRYKLCIDTNDAGRIYRLSPWAKYTIQNSETKLFEAYLWHPQKTYHWKFGWPLVSGPCDENLRIYEAHVGISSEDYHVASYVHFKEKVNLPYI